jgi:hypothetical protein
MVWPFGKKEKKGELELHELPELPELPPLPEGFETIPRMREAPERTKLPPLPAFPSTPTGERISQETVKQAVQAPPGIKPARPMPAVQKERPRTMEITENFPARRFVREERPFAREERPIVRAEPIFVRIDKYQLALEDFQNIKKKIIEIEALLRDIRGIREKEELELNKWEADVREAKDKLDDIDKTIFSKLENE